MAYRLLCVIAVIFAVHIHLFNGRAQAQDTPIRTSEAEAIDITQIDNALVKSRAKDVIAAVTQALEQPAMEPAKRGELLVWRARAYLVVQENIASDSDIQIATDLLGDGSAPAILCYAFTTEADRRRRLGELDVALQNYSNAYDACVESGEAKMAFATHVAKGTIFGITEDADAAREHFKSILANEGAPGSPPLPFTPELRFEVLYAYAVAMGNSNLENEALPIFRDTLALARDMDDGSQAAAANISFAAQGLGQTLSTLGLYDEALTAIDEADETNLRMNDLIGLALADAVRAEIQFERGDLDGALLAANAAMTHLDDTEGGARRFELDILEILSEIQIAKGDYVAATQTLQRAKALTETLFTERRASEVAKLQEQLQASRRASENTRLRSDLTTQRNRADRRQRELTFGLVALALALLIAAVIGALLLRTRRLAAVLSKTITQREALVREVNHRVKNNLQVILGFLQLQQEKLALSNAVPSNTNVLRDVETRIKAMALIHKQLNAEDPAGDVDMQRFVIDLGHEFSRLYSDIAKIEVTSEPFMLPLDRAVPLGLIISELVANAIEHAFPKRSTRDHVDVSLKASGDETIQLTVSDNGIGFDRNALNGNENPTLGLELIHSLADQIDGTITQGNQIPNGAKWVLDFKLGREETFESLNTL